jgi:hypothetical protein
MNQTGRKSGFNVLILNKHYSKGLAGYPRRYGTKIMEVLWKDFQGLTKNT